jgi:hypothetical protein
MIELETIAAQGEASVEEWRPIQGWDYSVSSCGRVRNDKTGKVSAFGHTVARYRQVILCANGKKQHFSVHRLVAQAFIPNPECKPEVNHINGDGLDNRVENLEWCTSRENVLHAHRVLGKTTSPENMAKLLKASNKACNKPVRCVETNEIYESATVAAKAVGCYYLSMIYHLNGKRSHCYGKHYEYV